jgi:hypothetical protein
MIRCAESGQAGFDARESLAEMPNGRALHKLLGFPVMFAACVLAVRAQQDSAAALQTLQKVRAKLETSMATLPNIDCDEHMRSVGFIDHKVKRVVTLDSTMHATRQPDADEFKEERTVRAVNGKAVNGNAGKKQRDVILPLSIAGGFGNSFSPYLALKYEQCHAYELKPSGNDKEMLMEVTGRLANYSNPACSQFRVETKARFWLDADSAQLLRMESVSPHAGDAIGFKTLTTRTEYALVPLGKSSYLLPVRVHAELALGNSDNVAMQYDAEYSNCHRFEVTMKILPGVSEVPVKPQ